MLQLLHSVDIHAKVAVVGERLSSTISNDDGLAHIFERGAQGWQRVAVVSGGPSQWSGSDEFGEVVACNDTSVYVSQHRALGASQSPNDGRILEFSRDPAGGWSNVPSMIMQPSSPGFTRFGRLFDFEDGVLVSAVDQPFVAPDDSRAAFLFSPGIGSSSCDHYKVAGTSRIQLDALEGDGGGLRLCVHGAAEPTTFVVGASLSDQPALPGAGMPYGTCLAPPVYRVASGVLSGAESIQITDEFGPRLDPLISAGNRPRLHFQVWSRSANGTRAFSNLVSLPGS